MMTSPDGDHGRPGLDIAIVGMAGRFPGAADVETFWRNLCAGTESVSFLTDEDLLGAGADPALLARPDYVRGRAVLEDIDLFDAAFFGFSPHDAAALNPQHRLFLECAWEAFENAGHDPERAGGRVGVYAGSSLNGYLFHVFPRGPRLQSAADVSALLACDKDFLPTLVSYKLNLAGPSVAVQTACSTSLVAVHLACQGLLGGECDLALAGGASIAVPQKLGYLYQQGGIASPDGHCRAFDARAQGTVGGSGVGVVLLKRLDEALADRDSILAVIKGSAVNNDGRAKIGYTAPSVEGQARVIRDAQAAAGVAADSIGYVEAHGTGTPLGDPIEIAALTQAFRASTDRKGFCAIGSVKTNVGHLDAAAGVTGLIKAALAVGRGRIPPSLHYQTPNPAIDFGDSPFQVSRELRAWAASDGTRRRAGVSAFGLGGTNAHVVLEEAPPPAAVDAATSSQLLVLSARSPAALDTLGEQLAAQLEARPELELADVAWTLQLGRRAFGHRRALVCGSREEAVRTLRRSGDGLRAGAPPTERPVAFLFPGQGAQQAGLGGDLQAAEPVFRAELDRCAEQLAPLLGRDIRGLLFPAPGAVAEAEAALGRTSFTQPALFAFEYALARLWMAWGLTPEVMIGHSVGEYVAACLAGCLSLEDALALVAARGRLMEATPEGAMLAVSASEEQARSWVSDEVALAAVNSDRQCVLAGSPVAIEYRERELAARGVPTRRVRTGRAFHSPLMDGALEAFGAAVARVTLRAPTIPWISNVTGGWITAPEAQDPAYWVRHLRSTVRFADGVRLLRARPERLLLEVGPGQTLTGLCRQVEVAGEANSVVVSSLPSAGAAEENAAHHALLDVAGRLWVAGAAVDFRGLQAGRRRRRVPLPTTPFERQRHWIERPGEEEPAPARASVDQWFYLPSWKRAALPAAVAVEGEGHWLVFADDQGIGPAVVRRLEQTGARVTRVKSGTELARLEGGGFALQPDNPDHYRALFQELAAAGAARPLRAVHAFSLAGDPPATLTPESFRRAQGRGAASVLWLARELGQDRAGARLVALASGIHDVTGSEALFAEHAPLAGVCRTVGQEYPRLRCALLDLEGPVPRRDEIETMVERIVAEARSGAGDPVVAYRGRHRWVPTVEARSLPAPAAVPRLLRDRGVYLITGGLGGVGLALAEFLARAARARLILTGRSPVTEGQRLRVRAIEELGAEVLLLRADAGDLAQMREALAGARQRFGRIDGVVHAAGSAAGALIERLTPATLEADLHAKAVGALVLEVVLRESPPDFILHCSSLTALSGGMGRAGYAAANAFLDALAQASNPRERPYRVSVNLDRWREVGMAARAEARLLGGGDELATGGMSAAEGQEVLARVLDQAALPQVVVSVRPLRGMPADEEGAALARRLGLGSGPAALAAPEPPGKDAALPDDPGAAMQVIWARAFGLDRVDPERDFFELGGESLLALQILNRVREGLGVELSLREFFEHRSISRLAERVRLARTRQPADQGPALVALPRKPRCLPPDDEAGRGPPPAAPSPGEEGR